MSQLYRNPKRQNSDMSYLEFDHVSFSYENGEEILKNFSLSVEKGEFVVILGKSGCGKSTLLSLVEGLIFPKEGEIRIDGEQVKGPALQKSILFQQSSLFPWMTVEKNVRFGIRQAKPGIGKNEEKRLALEALWQVGMEKDLKKYPFELSGGMQQRTALARTLAMDCEIFMMDEPFGAIDPKLRADLQEMLLSIWKKEKTILFVTHDMEEALTLGEWIVFLKEQGAYEVLKAPVNREKLEALFLGGGSV